MWVLKISGRFFGLSKVPNRNSCISYFWQVLFVGHLLCKPDQYARAVLVRY